jgi:Trypsin-like serine proteases, typically periplasmic, contain C-terminal PDZ domain
MRRPPFFLPALCVALSLIAGGARSEAPGSAAVPRLRSWATGFFVDGRGHVLTARHAVDGCRGVYLLRPGLVIPLTVVAADDATDLALVRAPETLGEAGAFAPDPPPTDGQAVFTASYADLLGHDIDGVLANGRVPARARAADGTVFPISSAAGAGTSGAPVVDRRGLVIGVVFARRHPTGAGRRLGIAAPLMAVEGNRAKAFLADHGVVPEDRAQAPRPDHAARADAARAYTIGIGCAG